MSKLSVIIPCYNASPYIMRCLDSLYKQDFSDFEIIVVDDCSTDDTFAVLSKASEQSPIKITTLRNEQNSGPAYSRRAAAQVCQSEYLAFCDADDWYDTNYLKLAVDSLNASPADMVIMGYKTVLSSKRSVKHHISQKDILNANKEDAFASGVSSLCAVVLKRELFFQVPHLDIRNGEDMAIIPPMIALADRINILNGCPYNYLCRQGSASGTANEKVVESLLLSFEHIQKHTPKQYSNYVEYMGIIIVLYGSLLCLFKYSYDTKKAREIIDGFALQYPNWQQNVFLQRLPKFKKVFLKATSLHSFPTLKAMSVVHKIMAN